MLPGRSGPRQVNPGRQQLPAERRRQVDPEPVRLQRGVGHLDGLGRPVAGHLEGDDQAVELSLIGRRGIIEPPPVS